MDASGLTEGAYHGNIVVTSNDPDEATVTVPVTMTVTQAQAAAISVSPMSLSYGNVTTGQSSTKQFTISLNNLNKALNEFLSLYKQGKANSLKIVRLK